MISIIPQVLIQEHLEGKKGIGSIPINKDNNCYFGVLYIDTYTIDHVEIKKFRIKIIKKK